MSRPADVAFVRQLASEVPALTPLLDEHLRAYEEILPHLFLADIAFLATDEPWDATLESAFACLERGFRDGDDDRRGLIATGFIENLPAADKPGNKLLTRLGPCLRDEARAISDWRPSRSQPAEG